MPADPFALGSFSSGEVAQLPLDTTPPAVAHQGQEAGVHQSTFNGEQTRSLPSIPSQYQQTGGGPSHAFSPHMLGYGAAPTFPGHWGAGPGRDPTQPRMYYPPYLPAPPNGDAGGASNMSHLAAYPYPFHGQYNGFPELPQGPYWQPPNYGFPVGAAGPMVGHDGQGLDVHGPVVEGRSSAVPDDAGE
jgi:hypothetical protein